MDSQIPKHTNNSYNTYLVNIACSSIFQFQSIAEKQTSEIIRKLKTKISDEHDGISTFLLQKINHTLSHCLTLIINQSLYTGLFPDYLKIDQVPPLHKMEAVHVFGNCRSISLPPALSKSLKRVFKRPFF